MEKKSGKKYLRKGLSNTTTYKLMMMVDLTFIFFSLILLLLYIVGSFQSFLDLTQKIILTTLSYTSIFSQALTFILFFETLIKIFTEKKKWKNISNLIFLLLSILVCLIELVFSSTMNFVSQGVN